MQSAQEFFCEECGAANPDTATHCIACHTRLSPTPNTPLPRPVVIRPAPVLQVIAGATPVTPDHAPAKLKRGALLQKRYRIEREIGQGGYSMVYEATDLDHHKRPVTIKQVNLCNLTPRQIIEATETFNREVTILPTLAHDNIPQFYSHFTDPEHWYLVMEYIPGQTLEEYMQNPRTGGYCSVTETLKIGVALASVLEYLHFKRQPVIFRDVKPANVMLTSSKKVYLIDFGIARLFHPRKAKDTTPLGSPGFAAPEQYGRAQSAQSDQRTDVYGLGATLQTLLTGRDPLELRAGEPSRRPSPVPAHLQTLLNEMMDADPRRRPRNMAAVKQRLKRVQAQLHWISNYIQGLLLGSLYCAMSYAGFANPFSTDILASLLACFWVPITMAGIIALFVFLFMVPARRYTAFGILTAIIGAFVLFKFII